MNNITFDELKVPRLPQKMTEPAEGYFLASLQIFGLFNFVVNTVISGDYMTYIAKKALAGEEIEKEIDPAILASKEPGPRTFQLRKYRQELLQAIFSRIVDNFEVYLVDILREVLKQKPEILRSRQQNITLEYLLQFQKIEDLIQDIIERKVNSLSYKGFLDIKQWYEEKGIPLIVDKEHSQGVVEIIAMRNIIVHNRGRVDEKYLRAIPTSSIKIGELRELSVDYLFSTLSILNTIVSETDHEIAQKFDLVTNFENKTFTNFESS
jgi:hypothetical protein